MTRDCPYCRLFPPGTPQIPLLDYRITDSHDGYRMAVWREHDESPEGGTTIHPYQFAMVMEFGALADKMHGRGAWVVRWETSEGHLRMTVIPMNNGSRR